MSDSRFRGMNDEELMELRQHYKDLGDKAMREFEADAARNYEEERRQGLPGRYNSRERQRLSKIYVDAGNLVREIDRELAKRNENSAFNAGLMSRRGSRARSRRPARMASVSPQRRSGVRARDPRTGRFVSTRY